MRRRRGRSDRRWLLILALAIVAALVLLSRTGVVPSPRGALAGEVEVVVAVLDVGQADGIVVRTQSGRAMLIDSGSSSRDATDVIIPYLRRHGVERLDVAVLTHPEQDHVGGLAEIMRRFPVVSFLDSGQVTTNRAYLEALELVEEKGISAHLARYPGMVVELTPDVHVRVLGPREPLLDTGGSRLNNNSVALQLVYGNVAVLLTGDLEREGEERLLRTREDLRSQVLKVGHHGSNTSTTQAFLDAVQPRVALISSGAANPYGHPHPQVLARLRQHGADVYRTDLHGTIEVSLTRDGYRVVPARNAP